MSTHGEPKAMFGKTTANGKKEKNTSTKTTTKNTKIIKPTSTSTTPPRGDAVLTTNFCPHNSKSTHNVLSQHLRQIHTFTLFLFSK